jgi:receptor expression-enhancing protein 1/2/3/4
VPKEAPPAAGVNTQKEAAPAETTSQATAVEAQSMQIEAAPAAPASSADENLNPPPKETVMEDAIRLTRGRLRKNRSSVKS